MWVLLTGSQIVWGKSKNEPPSPPPPAWLPLGLGPRQPWLWPPPPDSSQHTPGSSLAETLLRQKSGNLLFLVPTLGRKQFGEGNCKLAFVVEPAAPGLEWQGQCTRSPRLTPPVRQCQALSMGWLRCRWNWLVPGLLNIPSLRF